MDEKLFEELCKQAKRKCKITWTEEETEDEIKSIVEDAIEDLKQQLGMKEKDLEAFGEPGGTRKLFKNYCLYAWNDMVPEFWKNYLSDILRERHRYEVKYEREKVEQLQ